MFVMLLAALVHVVNGQVKQAQARQVQSQAMQAALAGCAAHPSGAVRRQCITRLDESPAPDGSLFAENEAQFMDQIERSGSLAGQGLSNESAGAAGLDRRSLSDTVFVPR